MHHRPVASGIPFTHYDKSKKPWVSVHKLANPKHGWNHSSNHTLGRRAACSQLSADNPATYWLADVDHNGKSSFMDPPQGVYNTFRNAVKDFGADNTGSRDASAAIQNAINGT